MRLLVFSQYFWPESFRINDLVGSLVDSGVKVDVLTGKPNYPDGVVFSGYKPSGCVAETWKGASIHRVPLVPRGKDSGTRLALNYLSFIVSAAVFGSWMLRRIKPDVVLVYALSPILQALPALLLARIKGCPLVLWVQDLWPESLEATGYVRNKMILAAVGKLVGFIYRHCDLILVSSRAFSPFVSSFAPSQVPAYYPNSVENFYCDPESGSKPIVPALDEGFAVVFAGNLGAAQSMETLIDAAERLREHRAIRFVVLGAGSRMSWMQAEIARRGLTNVFMAGRFPAEAMPFLLDKASALLVTLADRAIFAATVPSKVQAYMAVGRPILACLNGEGAQLVTEARAGIAVPAENSAALAEATLSLYRLPVEERAAMGTNGRSYFQQHFDHQTLVAELIRHLKTTVDRGTKK